MAEWWRGTHRALLESGRVEALTPELAERLAAEKGRWGLRPTHAGPMTTGLSGSVEPWGPTLSDELEQGHG